MCTTIATKHPLSGQAKEASEWFPIRQLYIAYDHPVREQSEHAVLIHFANEGAKRNVAIELSREDATRLARHLLDTVEEADRYDSR